MAKTLVLDPTGEAPTERSRTPAPLDSLEGKSIGFNVHWAKYDIFTSQAAILLKERYGVAATPRMDRPFVDNPQMLQDWLRDCDAAVIGLGA